MAFEDYTVFDPGVDRPLHEVGREEATRHFEHHITSLGARLAELQRLVAPAGIQLDFSDHSLDQLDEWFPEIIQRYGVDEEWPTPKALSVCNDVGMYLGETLRRKGSHLHWQMDISDRRMESYQRPFITGFTKVKYPKGYGVDYDLLLGGYAVRLAQGGQREPGYIPKIVKAIVQYI